MVTAIVKELAKIKTRRKVEIFETVFVISVIAEIIAINKGRRIFGSTTSHGERID
ncbi:MAG: hypothetical protein ACD_66C00055G0003 [uncultured bacterium]|nr:MAG: hypothetical protein ACD_66C00055G0003 [uncultured bacterium]